MRIKENFRLVNYCANTLVANYKDGDVVLGLYINLILPGGDLIIIFISTGVKFVLNEF